jgi:hypothetical protein
MPQYSRLQKMCFVSKASKVSKISVSVCSGPNKTLFNIPAYYNIVVALQGYA